MGINSVANEGSTVALGRGARAIRMNSVALGQGSVANVINTVSVGKKGAERRIMNVGAGKRPTDAVNVAQLQAAVAAATAKAKVTHAVTATPAAPPPPAVSVVPVGINDARQVNDDLRRRLYEPEALVKQQQHHIAQLESRIVPSAK